MGSSSSVDFNEPPSTKLSLDISRLEPLNTLYKAFERNNLNPDRIAILIEKYQMRIEDITSKIIEKSLQKLFFTFLKNPKN